MAVGAHQHAPPPSRQRAPRALSSPREGNGVWDRLWEKGAWFEGSEFMWKPRDSNATERNSLRVGCRQTGATEERELGVWGCQGKRVWDGWGQR